MMDTEQSIPSTTGPLTALKQFTRSQETRTSLLKEYEEAFDSNFSAHKDELQPTTERLADRTRARAVSDAEMQEIIRITTLGLLEIKDEIDLVIRVLREEFGQPDLATLVEKVKTVEAEKLQQTLTRDQRRRQAKVEGRDLEGPIAEHNKRISELKETINDLLEEIRGEMAEL